MVGLPELDRETILSFFRDVAEDEPFSEEALRQDPSKRLIMYLESVLLEVSNLWVHHPAAQDAAYQHLVCVFLAYTHDKASSTW